MRPIPFVVVVIARLQRCRCRTRACNVHFSELANTKNATIDNERKKKKTNNNLLSLSQLTSHIYYLGKWTKWEAIVKSHFVLFNGNQPSVDRIYEHALILGKVNEFLMPCHSAVIVFFLLSHSEFSVTWWRCCTCLLSNSFDIHK